MIGSTIVLASRTEQENFILRRKLESMETELGPLSFQGAHLQGVAAAVDSSTAAVVFNCFEWASHESSLLSGLRESGYRGPVLVIAKAEISEALRVVQAMDGVVFLEKPFETKDLLGIVSKMMNSRVVAQRIHRRYETFQDAEVELLDRSDRLTSRVRNLSRGGAYLEIGASASFKVGEMVKLKMELQEMNRTYTIPAKIVWTRNSASEGTGLGVEFVGPGDVQKQILGY